MVKTRLTKIGNSKGLIIPAVVLRECGFTEEANIEVEGNSLIITPSRQPREGWEESLKVAGVGDEELLLPDHLSKEWDEKEWEW